MSDSQNNITIEQAGIGTILKRHHLAVPPNQREYAWTDRQVKRLFEDFTNAVNANELSYFLGTIVTIPRAGNVLEVVDGQQRLATTALLLTAIRDHPAGKHELIVEAINEFLTGIDLAKLSRVPRLNLNVDDRDLFRWMIADGSTCTMPNPTKQSHELLIEARKSARRHVSAVAAPLSNKDQPALLTTWISFIEHRAQVILLRVPNDANAYKMFETLNDRGLRTTQADLIKNYLFGQSGDRIPETQAHWSHMHGVLESLDDDDIAVDFIRHALTAIYAHTRESQVYDVVQDKVRGEQGAVTFVSTLDTLATEYVATFNPAHEKWNDHPESAARAIDIFNMVNVRPLRALLLAIGTTFKPKELTIAFRFLVSLAVRLLITASTRTGSLESSSARAAHEVYTGAITDTKQLKAALKSATPSNEDFERAFASAKVSKAQLARYYLRCLETAAKGDPEPWFLPTSDPDIINLEHVLPRKPEGNWPEFTSDEVPIYVTRLGNQALMKKSDNSTAKSDPFSAKSPIYQASPYSLTSHIAAYPAWSADAIAARQEELAKLALLAWPL